MLGSTVRHATFIASMAMATAFSAITAIRLEHDQDFEYPGWIDAGVDKMVKKMQCLKKYFDNKNMPSTRNASDYKMEGETQRISASIIQAENGFKKAIASKDKRLAREAQQKTLDAYFELFDGDKKEYEQFLDSRELSVDELPDDPSPVDTDASLFSRPLTECLNEEPPLANTDSQCRQAAAARHASQ